MVLLLTSSIYVRTLTARCRCRPMGFDAGHAPFVNSSIVK
jgi:hypothetical protein